MCSTTASPCAMNRYESFFSRCMSIIRLIPCAWIDTSSAETGSSATISLGFSASARNRNPLALTAGEFVREALHLRGGEADLLEQRRDVLGPLLSAGKVVHL